MDIWLKITNQVTVGNISAVIFLLSAIVVGYYKIRRLIAKQHFDFLAYVQSLTEEQTTRIEACIHKIPSHPENITPGTGTGTGWAAGGYSPPGIVVNTEDSTKVP